MTDFAFRSRLVGLLLCCWMACAWGIPLAAAAAEAEAEAGATPDSKEQVDALLKQAADLYRNRDYAAAAVIYRRVSESANAEQAAWALELYGVCLEQQGDQNGALALYEAWLQQYAGTSGEVRVQQRAAALLTASQEPQSVRKLSSAKTEDLVFYGSSSLMYRGVQSKVEDQDATTPVSSLSSDLDLHVRAHSGNIVWRGRLSGGYLSDQSDRGDSNGRASNLYINMLHEPSGAELTLGRQRATDNGIYGYFDGATFGYPLGDMAALKLLAGGVNYYSGDAPSSDHMAYGVATEFHFPQPAVQLGLYVVEQTYDGLTERRAVGGEFSYFDELYQGVLIADYDFEFGEINNVTFNGSRAVGDSTTVSLSLGYQRSPFLSTTNALIGEYDMDFNQLVERLGDGLDIYDAALERTALSEYASLVVNYELTDSLRMVGEAFYYQISELPQYDPNYSTPDSDANTTLGLQFIWSDVLFGNDMLSTGLRYTDGDTSGSVTVYADEKLRFENNVDVIFRLSGSQRWLTDYSQDAFTVRPGVRLEWYIKPDLMLDSELGYEWLSQDFQSDTLVAQQAYVVLALRKRF
ncbi:MAG: tetratricopeptide repeat protein [Halioglobus sp.]